jgi:rod shape-determining protein MreC
LKRRTFSKSLVRAIPLPFGGRRHASLFFLLVAAIFLTFSALSPQGASDVRARLSDLMAPTLQVVSAPVQNAVSFVRGVSGLAHMQSENQRLLEENIQLKAWYQTAQNLQMENEALQALLKVKIHPKSNFITARILTDTGNRFVKSLLVTAGSGDGVHKSQAVISEDGAIGRIVEVGQNVSRILLMTDINSRIPVMIEDGAFHAILAGQNDANPVLEHLPADVTIKDGSRIITSGRGGIFQPGLPVGRVVQEGGVYKVELFADLSRLMYVRIIEEAPDFNLIPAH